VRPADLESVLGVLDEVDSEVEVDGRGKVRREGGESEDLDGSAGRSAWFAGQSVPGQVVRHDVTLAGVHLDVDRRVDRLATQLAHRLHARVHTPRVAISYANYTQHITYLEVL